MKIEEAQVITHIKQHLYMLDADIKRLAEIDAQAQDAVNLAITKLEDLKWWLENGVFPSEEE